MRPRYQRLITELQEFFASAAGDDLHLRDDPISIAACSEAFAAAQSAIKLTESDDGRGHAVVTRTYLRTARVLRELSDLQHSMRREP